MITWEYLSPMFSAKFHSFPYVWTKAVKNKESEKCYVFLSNVCTEQRVHKTEWEFCFLWKKIPPTDSNHRQSQIQWNQHRTGIVVEVFLTILFSYAVPTFFMFCALLCTNIEGKCREYVWAFIDRKETASGNFHYCGAHFPAAAATKNKSIGRSGLVSRCH